MIKIEEISWTVVIRLYLININTNYGKNQKYLPVPFVNAFFDFIDPQLIKTHGL